MFITIQHEIHDLSRFQECAGAVFPLPDGLHFHHFLPTNDMQKAVCLYEAPTVDQLRVYLDGKLNGASTQRYFPINEDNAMGLPERQIA
jgi:hypothetical protein